MSLQEQVTRALTSLIGLPLWCAVRVADLEMFDFGERRFRLNRKGEQIEVGEIALHVQCPWRIVDSKGIVTGTYDRIYPADDEEDWLNFDGSANPSRCEARLAMLFEQHAKVPLTVESVSADFVGGFRVMLHGEIVLEAFPAVSRRREPSEIWRLFRSATGSARSAERHFVVTDNGITDPKNTISGGL